MFLRLHNSYKLSTRISNGVCNWIFAKRQTNNDCVWIDWKINDFIVEKFYLKFTDNQILFLDLDLDF